MSSPSPRPARAPRVSFSDLGVADEFLSSLAGRQITIPTPVQAATIPDALAGRDVAGRAPTGSGKTLAFGLPLVARVAQAERRRPRALVLAPTRELAAQIADELEPLARIAGRRVFAFYGGVGFEPQLRALSRGVDIVVACPGRLADLINRGNVDLADVDMVVVDEADRMADMGFLPEVRRLLDQTSAARQTLLFSATLDGDVDVLIRKYQTNPARHDVPDTEVRGPVAHHFWKVAPIDRTKLTAQVVAASGPTVVFVRTRHGADRLAKNLARQDVAAAAIHGDRSQAQRDRALHAFRSGTVDVLVATDVAARGIHVDDVGCVVHFDLPADDKDYVHRSGRTGRAGASGTVVAMVGDSQHKDARQMARRLDLNVELIAPDVTRLAPAPTRRTPRPARPEMPARPERPRQGSTHARREMPSGGRARGRRPVKPKGKANSKANGAGANPPQPHGRRRPNRASSRRPA